MSEPTLLEETLIKRSQQKRKTSPLNYKQRLFVLTKSHLAYYSGQAEKRLLRGSIELSRIHCVEIVKSGNGVIPCQNKYPFQVLYDANTLYVFAPSHERRVLWVQSLKDEIKDNQEVSAKFHPQFWQEGAWLCCRQGDKQAPGCQKYNPNADISRKTLPLTPGDRRPPPPPLPPPPLPPGCHHGGGGGGERGVVVALFDLVAGGAQELRLSRGDEFVVLERRHTHWIRARNKFGEEGYIPANYVVEKKTSEDLVPFAWFHRRVDRNMAEELLRNKDKEGAFIVRESSVEGSFTVSVYSRKAGSARHYQIKETQDSPPQYFLSERHIFSSIPELVEYHLHNTAGLVTRLRFPVEEDASTPVAAAQRACRSL